MISLQPDTLRPTDAPVFPIGATDDLKTVAVTPSYVLQDDGGDFILLDDDGGTDRLTTGM